MKDRTSKRHNKQLGFKPCVTTQDAECNAPGRQKPGTPRRGDYPTLRNWKNERKFVKNDSDVIADG